MPAGPPRVRPGSHGEAAPSTLAAAPRASAHVAVRKPSVHNRQRDDPRPDPGPVLDEEEEDDEGDEEPGEELADQCRARQHAARERPMLRGRNKK